MSLSKVAYTAAPAQTVFNITFPSLSSNHVSVFVDTVELVQPTEFTVNAARTQVTLVTPATGGEYVVLQRVTPSTAIVDWQPGGSILDEDLDTLYLQLLYRQQELEDVQAETLQLTEDGSDVWDADGKRITNVADGVANQDAVTKFQLDAAQMNAGNLPVVTGADNDKFIQVKAGAWVTRTPAQVEADIGVDTLQSQMVTAQAEIAALKLGQPLAVANATTTVLFNSSSGTWYENANSRIPLNALAIQRNNTTPHFTLGADTVTITQDGDYLVEAQVYFSNSEAEEVSVDWRLTDGTDGPAQVEYARGFGVIMEAIYTGAISAADQYQWQRKLVKVTVSGTPKVLVLRAKSFELFGGTPGPTIVLQGATNPQSLGLSFIRVERMATP